MTAALAMHLKGHPDRALRVPSSEYNCVGLVFASRRTWVDIEHLSWLLDDDGYRQVAESKVRVGDLLVYKDASGYSHVAIVWERVADIEKATWRTRVLSQWGQTGEYFHAAADVPDFLGAPNEFWTDRPL